MRHIIVISGSSNSNSVLVFLAVIMLMTHLPETRVSNPALETRKCDMLSSAGF